MRKQICYIGIGVLIITILFGTITYCCNGYCWKSVFNSSFGVLNAFFSGLAFTGVIATLFWQQKDSNIKSFESNLYKQIEFFLHLVESLTYKNPDGADPYEGKGRDIFEWFYEEKNYFVDGINDLRGMKEKLKADSQYIDRDANVFESYFNYLFNTYKYIDDAQMERFKKQDYANQLTALLSKYELLLIFYYVESLRNKANNRKYKRISELCIKFGIFKNMNTAYLADLNHVNLIDKNAFL